MGIVLYFYALRSGHYAYTFAGNALSCNGDSDGGGVASWFAVRPAHELTCICHSEPLAKNLIKNGNALKMGHFGKRQCDRKKKQVTRIPFFKESGTELLRVEGNFVLS